MKKNGAVFLEVALGVVTHRQTPCVTISRTTAIDFALNYKSKKFITHTHICGAFCGINQSLIKSV